MKTKTEIISDSKSKRIRMVDAEYRVTLELSYADASAILTALKQLQKTYVEAAEKATRHNLAEVNMACSLGAKSIGKAAKAFNMQSLIEEGSLKLGRNAVQQH